MGHYLISKKLLEDKLFLHKGGRKKNEIKWNAYYFGLTPGSISSSRFFEATAWLVVTRFTRMYLVEESFFILWFLVLLKEGKMRGNFRISSYGLV